MPPHSVVPAGRIARAIVFLRGHKVMLDSDLARLYGVSTKALVQAVKRNRSRFPSDFMFRLSSAEFTDLRSRTVTSKSRGGRRTAPHAFTEQGVVMLSSVLRSPRAVQVNIAVMRVFVRLRSILESRVELARKLEQLERKYDAKFAIVFDAIRELMAPPPSVRRRIGFKGVSGRCAPWRRCARIWRGRRPSDSSSERNRGRCGPVPRGAVRLPPAA